MVKLRKKKGSKLPKRADLSGKVVGSLKVISDIVNKRAWLCLCGCGKFVEVKHNRLIDKNNPKTHCGCKRGGLPKKFFREYHSWWDMRARCSNVDHPSYRNYGGRGLTVCKAWQDSFEAFLKDMGSQPLEYILVIREGETEYGPGRCGWLPMKQKTIKNQQVPSKSE